MEQSLKVNVKNQWPKILPQLTKEQKLIKEELISIWYKDLPKRGAFLERFNHTYALKGMKAKQGPIKTLEIGAGIGGHIAWENLSLQDYHAIEWVPEMAEIITQRFPQCHVIKADCQQSLPFPDQHFDRIIAVHVLEHLPDLPGALKEIKRVCKKSGIFSVVIPCEGGALYSLARNLSTRRILEKKFGKGDYEWLFLSEHCNYADEIIKEIKKDFTVIHTGHFPFVIPNTNINLFIGLTLKIKDQ